MVAELIFVAALTQMSPVAKGQTQFEHRLAETWKKGDRLTLRFTDVFVRRRGQWLVVASHATRVGS